MLNSLIRHIIFAILSIFSLVTVCCDRHSKSWNEMELAENLMELRPDSALVILTNLSPSQFSGRKESARYALLMSMALDKNYIDTTTFEVLQPAIDYYLRHGKPDEKFCTYYYQGRIFQNRGENDLAMKSFMSANDLRNEVTDSLLLARNLVALGVLYYEQYKIEDFITNNLEAAKLYGIIGKGLLEIKSYAKALNGVHSFVIIV